MIGILAAAANEINYSETVLQQVQHVQVRILILTAVVVYSSLTPILKGAKSEAFGKAAVRVWAHFVAVLTHVPLPDVLLVSAFA